MQNKKEIYVDAVITWVDSSDQDWQNKINNYLEHKIDWNDKKQSTRFNSINEIEIAILSIITFASFVKNIFLVTDSQTPKNFDSLRKKALENDINLTLIDHTEIFKNKTYLPTFNSRSIETSLYKIPNLSNYFIVFNDDTFLMRETQLEDFFIDGIPVVRGKWSKYYEDLFFRNIYQSIKKIFSKSKTKKAGYKLAQQQSAKLIGLSGYIKRDHTPVSIRKSTLISYFQNHPEELENNLKHRFRHHSQFLIASLSNHLEYLNKTCILVNDYHLSYFQSYNYYKTKVKLHRFDNDRSKKFMCFQSLELAPTKTLHLILGWIDHKLQSNFKSKMS